MSFEPIRDASLAIHIHLATVIPAFLLGTWLIFFSRKGARPHRQLFRSSPHPGCYAAALIEGLNFRLLQGCTPLRLPTSNHFVTTSGPILGLFMHRIVIQG